MSTILFCTVGGSHQPILRALEKHRPDRVVFICSADDPVNGRPGSRTQITGKGLVCRSDGPSGPSTALDLPNIPAQLGLPDDRFTVLEVPADDPVVAVERIIDRLARATGEGTAVIADYTGGTKSMTAALFHAAALTPGVELSLVSGPRVDLIKVVDGTEKVHRLRAAHRLETPWRLAEAERAWSRYAYAEAANIVESVADDGPSLARALILSRAFAAWDGAEHARAQRLLRTLGGEALGPYLGALGRLVGPLDGEAATSSRTAHHIWDLLLAAARHTQTHRPDTAVLLRYRAFEWIAQWSLRWHHGIDTADAPLEGDVAEGPLAGLAHRHHDGRGKIGAHNAWTALGRLSGPLAGVAQKTAKSRLGFNELRNKSRFAHATHPISPQEDRDSAAWFVENVQSEFLAVAFKGGKAPFGQLPSSLSAVGPR